MLACLLIVMAVARMAIDYAADLRARSCAT
jgi:hypothetical protein